MVKGVGSKIKWKRKKWFNVHSPEFLGNNMIGQTPGVEASQIKGRNLKVTVAELTGERRKQEYTLNLKIINVSGSNAETTVKSFLTSPSHVKRFVRKGGSRIDINEIYETKDSKKINLKAMIFTHSKCEANKKKEVRNKASDLVKKQVLKQGFEELVASVIKTKFQENVKKNLNKVRPIKFVEIVSFTKLSE